MLKVKGRREAERRWRGGEGEEGRRGHTQTVFITEFCLGSEMISFLI